MSTASVTIERPRAWARAPGALRGFAGVLVAGGIAGVAVGGVGSRVVMRLAALAAPETVHGTLTEAGATVGEITLEGTLFLVLFAGIGSAIFGTACYLAARPWLPRRRALRAVAFGGVELVTFGTVVLDPGNADFTILGRPVLNVLMFAGLFVLHGVSLVLLIPPSRRLVERIAGRGVWWNRMVAGGTLVALALMAIATIALGSRGQVPIATVTLIVCAVGLALIDPERARPVTRPALWTVGGLALGVIVVSGALGLVDAAVTILG